MNSPLPLARPATSPSSSEAPCPMHADKRGSISTRCPGVPGQGLLWGSLAKGPPGPWVKLHPVLSLLPTAGGDGQSPHLHKQCTQKRLNTSTREYFDRINILTYNQV